MASIEPDGRDCCNLQLYSQLIRIEMALTCDYCLKWGQSVGTEPLT